METKETKIVSRVNTVFKIFFRMFFAEVLLLDGDLEMKKRILDKAGEQFLKFGYTRITMDDLASSIGISKKTLYKHFRSKEELIATFIKSLMQEIMKNITNIIHNPETEYLVKLKQLIIFLGNFAAKIGLLPFQELQKAVPHLYQEFDAIREKFILANFRGFFQEGIQKGVIRKDVDLEIILLVFVNSIRGVINPKALAELPFTVKDAFDGIIKVIYNGILTEGHKIMESGLERGDE